jgi:DNA-binding NarL/FixJ family response regulator
MIKILLADDHSIVRNDIRNFLEKENNIEIVGEARNADEIFRLLITVSPHILLADVNISGINGIEIAAKLKNENSLVKVMLLTTADSQQYINNAFKVGAAAYLSKNITAEELLFAITQVYAGNRYLSSALSLRLLDLFVSTKFREFEYDANIQFSERELTILKLMSDGHTNQEIADHLFTSKRTVEGHRQAMIDKTGVRNTAALISFAMYQKLL